MRFDNVRDCFRDEKVSLCLEVVCDEKEVARKRDEGAVHRSRSASANCKEQVAVPQGRGAEVPTERAERLTIGNDAEDDVLELN